MLPIMVTFLNSPSCAYPGEDANFSGWQEDIIRLLLHSQSTGRLASCACIAMQCLYSSPHGIEGSE